MPVMVVICALVGAALAMGNDLLLGLGAGAITGYLVSRLSGLRCTLDMLKAKLDAQRGGARPTVKRTVPARGERPPTLAASPDVRLSDLEPASPAPPPHVSPSRLEPPSPSVRHSASSGKTAEPRGALLRSVSVQALLSIYWGMLALSGMVFGARPGRRVTWLTGTVLMALVIAKLFLVDLGNAGTVTPIISFLGVGGLLLIVGSFVLAPTKIGLVETAK